MQVLIDTHVFLWFVTGSSRLNPAVRALLEDEDTTALLSIVSIWEMVIKHSQGRLEFAGGFSTVIRHQLMVTEISVLPLSIDHCIRVAVLPFHHRDPFDRVIVAQALEQGIPLISADRVLGQYGVTVIW